MGSSELDADLIVVPTLAKSERLPDLTRLAPRPTLISSSFGQPGMMQSSSEFGGGVDLPTTAYQTPKVGLMISAITKDNLAQGWPRRARKCRGSGA